MYDVSSSANFQPGAPYHFLAGADATVGLAMMPPVRSESFFSVPLFAHGFVAASRSYERSLVNSLRYGELEAGDWQATERNSEDLNLLEAMLEISFCLQGHWMILD